MPRCKVSLPPAVQAECVRWKFKSENLQRADGAITERHEKKKVGDCQLDIFFFRPMSLTKLNRLQIMVNNLKLPFAEQQDVDELETLSGNDLPPSRRWKKGFAKNQGVTLLWYMSKVQSFQGKGGGKNHLKLDFSLTSIRVIGCIGCVGLEISRIKVSIYLSTSNVLPPYYNAACPFAPWLC